MTNDRPSSGSSRSPFVTKRCPFSVNASSDFPFGTGKKLEAITRGDTEKSAPATTTVAERFADATSLPEASNTATATPYSPGGTAKNRLARNPPRTGSNTCLLYTSDAADDLLCVD